jgi:hypothetical protein
MMIVPSPDLGQFNDTEDLVPALRAVATLSNEEPTGIAEGLAPNLSICAGTVVNNESPAGAVVFQDNATFDGRPPITTEQIRGQR